MLFKLISLSIIILVIVACINMNTHESSTLLYSKNEIQKEINQVSPQQKEYLIVKDDCKSYIATPRSKICLPLNPLVGSKKDTETNTTASLPLTSEEFSIPKYYNNSEDILSVPDQPTKAVDTSKEKQGVVFINPF